jgi:hypothetical protein
VAEPKFGLLDKWLLSKKIRSKPHLSSTSKCLAAALLDHFNAERSQCNPGFSALERAIGRKRRIISEALKELLTEGDVVRKRRRGASWYDFPELPGFEDRQKKWRQHEVQKAAPLVGGEVRSSAYVEVRKSTPIQVRKTAPLNPVISNPESGSLEHDDGGGRGARAGADRTSVRASVSQDASVLLKDIASLARFFPGQEPSHWRDLDAACHVQMWLDRGWHTELILTAVQVTIQKRKGVPPHTIKYFDKPIAQLKEKLESEAQQPLSRRDYQKIGEPFLRRAKTLR